MRLVKAKTSAEEFIAADFQVRCDKKLLELMLRYEQNLRGCIATTQDGRLILLLRHWPQQQDELPAALEEARRVAEAAEEPILRLMLLYLISGGWR